MIGCPTLQTDMASVFILHNKCRTLAAKHSDSALHLMVGNTFSKNSSEAPKYQPHLLVIVWQSYGSHLIPHCLSSRPSLVHQLAYKANPDVRVSPQSRTLSLYYEAMDELSRPQREDSAPGRSRPAGKRLTFNQFSNFSPPSCLTAP